ncbi:hypothetical protein SCHPADRAFT_935312 [Schizopora paradoxa]|uniref:Uncharacterized protein n=1 Tax=Schizopora paradoxa TaxID=27342 RepID=A0A0H2S6G0_9AGAM|nr:hypothetical protein SCHPADRAFT_935312 [Schizopora paradoxa]
MSNPDAKASAASAKVHTHQSNRKTRDPSERKQVFKAALDNPFHINWPQIPSNVENAILARVIELLQGVAEYNLKRRCDTRKAKTKVKSKMKAKSKDVVMADDGEETAQAGPSTGSDMAETSVSEKPGEPSNSGDLAPIAPEILNVISVGINDVTRRLEAQSRSVLEPPTETISVHQSEMADATTEATPQNDDQLSRSPVRAVLVCKADIDPPMIVHHIPYLVASCNSKVRTGGEPVRLVTLPKGAELSLAQAFGLRRAAIMSLDDDAVTDPMLKSLLDSVPPVVAPWVVGPLPVPRAVKGVPEAQRKLVHNRKDFVPTNIKHIRTTMPKDMKQHKAKRAKERAEAKKRRKERMKKGESKAENPVEGTANTTVAS